MNIKGVFEIHITVDISDGLYNLWNFTAKNKKNKLILAVSRTGKIKEQYMISRWTNGSYEEVLEKTKEIVKEMETFGLKVIRSKIEAMASNKGVPQTNEEYRRLIDENELNIVGTPYFEYHCKIDLNGKTTEEFDAKVERIKRILPEDVFAATSVNICGSKVNLLTIRVYEHGQQFALEMKDQILDSVKEEEFIIIGGLQQEFSVYDTNDFVDDGWLF